MTKFKKIILLSTMVLTVGAASVTVFAATPAATSGGIDTAKLEELKAERLELRKEILTDRVDAGIITQDQANTIIDQIEAKQAVCDGTGTYGLGRRMGAGFGNGQSLGNGQGRGGQGLGIGGCIYSNQN